MKIPKSNQPEEMKKKKNERSEEKDDNGKRVSHPTPKSNELGYPLVM